MKKVARIAVASLLMCMSAGPVLAQAPVAARPSIVSYAVPSAGDINSVLGSGSRAMKAGARKSRLLGGGSFSAAGLLAALAAAFGYTSVQAFLASLGYNVGNSPT